jgi:RNA polymerase sigma-70 factor (ECF subfamily)
MEVLWTEAPRSQSERPGRRSMVASEADGSFDRFFSEQRGPLFAQAYALTGNVDESHDLVQEVMLRTWRRWDQVSKLELPSAWARKVLTNLTIDRWRRIRRHPQEEFVDQAVPGPTIEHLDVAKALRALPDSQRTALLLHDVVGYSVAEVAAEMGAPEGSVRAWLSRGRHKLADDLHLSNSESHQGKIK